jgi:hypothetical protein
MARIDTTIAFASLAADIAYEGRMSEEEATSLAPSILAHLREAWSSHEADGRVARAGEWRLSGALAANTITLWVSVWGFEGEPTEKAFTLARAASPLTLGVEAAREALAAAYGGMSQFGSPEMARVIAGHHRNGGPLACFPVVELIEEFAAQDARQWADCGAERGLVAAEIRAAL